MAAIPSFFVPSRTLETQESVFADFARLCGVPVPPQAERIYSITFTHDGTIWHATVGESMHGTRHTTHKAKGRILERSQSVSDPAIVLAIFPGPPCYMVVTNHRLEGMVGSRWENPFLAGQPESVTRFSLVR